MHQKVSDYKGDLEQ